MPAMITSSAPARRIRDNALVQAATASAEGTARSYRSPDTTTTSTCSTSTSSARRRARLLIGKQISAVERTSHVPVGGVQQSHGPKLRRAPTFPGSDTWLLTRTCVRTCFSSVMRVKIEVGQTHPIYPKSDRIHPGARHDRSDRHRRHRAGIAACRRDRAVLEAVPGQQSPRGRGTADGAGRTGAHRSTAGRAQPLPGRLRVHPGPRRTRRTAARGDRARTGSSRRAALHPADRCRGWRRGPAGHGARGRRRRARSPSTPR